MYPLDRQMNVGVICVSSGYIGEFEIIDDHRAGKIVVNLTGRLNKVRHQCMLSAGPQFMS